MATIYEQYQPERFQMVMFNSSTRSLDVCEVCASYQCPYCPIYSHGVAMQTLQVSVMFLICLVVYVTGQRGAVDWVI